jgi:hypothetical protein
MFLFSGSGALKVVEEKEKKYAGEEQDLGDIMEDFLTHKQQSTSTPLRPQYMQPDVSSTKQEMLQDVTEQLERLETTSPSVVTTVHTHKQGTLPFHGY